MNPRSLIRAIDKHWELIERLISQNQTHIAFEREQLLILLQKSYPSESSQQHIERFQQLINAELLVEMSHSNMFQLDENVRQFVGSLLHEHELGLSEILKTRIVDIKTGLEQLQQAVADHDMAVLQRGAIRIDNQLRQVLQQLDQDSHAIQAIAERAKSADSQMPLTRRYREVLEAFDRYVEPMTDLMDVGAGGSFYPLLENAELILEALGQQLAIQGGLYNHQLTLRQVGFRVKDLRQKGRITLTQCTNTLMPLREEVRRHDKLSSAIGYLVGEIRKKGLNQTLSLQKLPFCQKERSISIYVGSELLSLMENVRGYQSKTVEFPESLAENSPLQLERVDGKAIENHLYQSLPVSDLMRWLIENYSDYQDITLLRLYHKLIRLQNLDARPESQKSHLTLKQITIQLHSHALKSL
jgi:hypothetical protein